MDDFIRSVPHMRDIQVGFAEYQEFLGRANDASFIGIMLELILKQQIPLSTRQLAMYELTTLTFHLNVEIVDLFLTLLFDDSTQVLRSKLL